ncbi:MAG: L-threonylcarbamoyladenylate synthase [Candidatus Thermoplasmatota archaeon]|nr:L-threonylcarbamoyladenylate synthase [Candidatus Thermoplasmatota archaeon]
MEIDAARAHLRNGGLLVYPTDTLWGLGCAALDSAAVARLLRLKSRTSNGLSVMVGAVEQLWSLGKRLPMAEGLATRWLPGPLTLVLPAVCELPEGVGRKGTVGLRVPDHPVALALADDLPVVTTSANRHGDPPPGSLEEACEMLGDSVCYLAGASPQGVASTVVCVDEAGFRVLREGAISAGELEASLAV